MSKTSSILASNKQMLPSRRPRGRPFGSKNRPKPPIVIARESTGALRAHAVEVSSGSDIAQCVASLEREHGHGICLLGGSGCVANVTVRQPGSGTAVVALNGRFEILSLVGSFLPPPAPCAVATGLTVFLAGPRGQVIGGIVVGPLLALGSVVVMAASFASATFDRLPLDANEDAEICSRKELCLRRQLGTFQNSMMETVSMSTGTPKSVISNAISPPELSKLYAWRPGVRRLAKTYEKLVVQVGKG